MIVRQSVSKHVIAHCFLWDIIDESSREGSLVRVLVFSRWSNLRWNPVCCHFSDRHCCFSRSSGDCNAVGGNGSLSHRSWRSHYPNYSFSTSTSSRIFSPSRKLCSISSCWWSEQFSWLRGLPHFEWKTVREERSGLSLWWILRIDRKRSGYPVASSSSLSPWFAEFFGEKALSEQESSWNSYPAYPSSCLQWPKQRSKNVSFHENTLFSSEEYWRSIQDYVHWVHWSWRLLLRQFPAPFRLALQLPDCVSLQRGKRSNRTRSRFFAPYMWSSFFHHSQRLHSIQPLLATYAKLLHGGSIILRGPCVSTFSSISWWKLSGSSTLSRIPIRSMDLWMLIWPKKLKSQPRIERIFVNAS